MRNLNLDAQAAQHPKGSGQASTSATSPGSGMSAELAAEMAAGSSLLQHFPGFADPAQMRRWASDPSAMAAAAAASYMGSMGSSAFANAYSQAALRDLAASAGVTSASAVTAGSGAEAAGLDFLATASFAPTRMPGQEDDDLNDDLIDDGEDEFEPEDGGHKRQSVSPFMTATTTEANELNEQQQQQQTGVVQDDDNQNDRADIPVHTQ